MHLGARIASAVHHEKCRARHARPSSDRVLIEPVGDPETK
jgi:hypothetical protein